MVPTLTHYSNIVSDIPSGCIYGIYTLTFYLTFFLAFYLASVPTFFLAFYLTSILAFFFASIQSFILASISTFSPTWALLDLNRELQISVGTACRTSVSSRLRSGSAHWDLEFAVGRRKDEVTLIESRDPHLAGGEKALIYIHICIYNIYIYLR